MEKIRAHHLFCLLAYEGKGYNKEFRDNFHKLQQFYFTSNNIIIPILEPDIGCQNCPYSLYSQCQAPPGEIHIIESDKKTLNLLNIKPNTKYKTQQIWEKVNTLNIDKVFDLCKNCSWVKKQACPTKILLKVKKLLKLLKS